MLGILKAFDPWRERRVSNLEDDGDYAIIARRAPTPVDDSIILALSATWYRHVDRSHSVSLEPVEQGKAVGNGSVSDGGRRVAEGTVAEEYDDV